MDTVAGRTSYFYFVSVQEGTSLCEVGESVGLKRNRPVVATKTPSPVLCLFVERAIPRGSVYPDSAVKKGLDHLVRREDAARDQETSSRDELHDIILHLTKRPRSVPAYSPTHLLKDSKAEGVTQILAKRNELRPRLSKPQ
jgi:hypothetical protein